jgi:hypothetical protein
MFLSARVQVLGRLASKWSGTSARRDLPFAPAAAQCSFEGLLEDNGCSDLELLRIVLSAELLQA